MHSSWLDQVELWFAKIELDVIASGAFTSVTELTRKLMRNIRQYNKQTKSVKWKYFDPPRRITPESIVAAHSQANAFFAAPSISCSRSAQGGD